MGPKLPGTKHVPAQDSDSDQVQNTDESDTEVQISDSEEQEDEESEDQPNDSEEQEDEESEDQPNDSEDQEKSEEESEGQNYRGMSMQELLKLQEDMGTKAFRNKVLKKGGGIVSKGNNINKPTVKQGSKTVLKQGSKNRPVEVPMMRHAAPRMATLDPGHSTKRMIVRDPRFDDLSGNLNLKAWQENYSFLRETRKKEKEVLKKELKAEQDSEKKRRIKSIIQRMENQERERTRREKEREMKRQERQEQREALRQGRKPKFLSNKERKLLVKAAHFEDLKKSNKLEKYLERKEKRLKAKEMKRKY